jgi:hypothetical protein
MNLKTSHEELRVSVRPARPQKGCKMHGTSFVVGCCATFTNSSALLRRLPFEAHAWLARSTTAKAKEGFFI